MGKRQHRYYIPGQALIELALALTLIAMFLRAAVDLGLAYKAYQTLLNSTAEASSYLSLNPVLNCSVHLCPDGTPKGSSHTSWSARQTDAR